MSVHQLHCAEEASRRGIALRVLALLYTLEQVSLLGEVGLLYYRPLSGPLVRCLALLAAGQVGSAIAGAETVLATAWLLAVYSGVLAGLFVDALLLTLLLWQWRPSRVGGGISGMLLIGILLLLLSGGAILFGVVARAM